MEKEQLLFNIRTGMDDYFFEKYEGDLKQHCISQEEAIKIHLGNYYKGLINIFTRYDKDNNDDFFIGFCVYFTAAYHPTKKYLDKTCSLLKEITEKKNVLFKMIECETKTFLMYTDHTYCSFYLSLINDLNYFRDYKNERHNRFGCICEKKGRFTCYIPYLFFNGYIDLYKSAIEATKKIIMLYKNETIGLLSTLYNFSKIYDPDLFNFCSNIFDVMVQNKESILFNEIDTSLGLSKFCLLKTRPEKRLNIELFDR